jgi:predicted transcriptional regulator
MEEHAAADMSPEEELRFLAAVDVGIAAAERGEFIEEDEMDARVARMLSS